MTYKLSQYAKLEKQSLAKGVMMGLAMEGLIPDILSWRNLDALSETGTRFDEVPAPAYIPLDGTISEATVDGHQITWSVYEMAHHIDIPAALEDTTGQLIKKPSTQQITLAVKGASYVVNNQFFNGDQASDPNGFEGLNKIVANLSSRQTYSGVDDAGSSEIDMAGTYATYAPQILNAVHASMHYVEGHKPDAAFCNETFLLKFEEVLRREQLLGNDYNWVNNGLLTSNQRATERTASEKPAMMYRGVPFFDVGVKGDQTTKIIGDTYTEGGSSSSGTRIFFVKFGPDDLEGLQVKPLSVDRVGSGTLEDKDNYRWRLKWIHGIAVWGPRSIVKLQGVSAV